MTKIIKDLERIGLSILEAKVYYFLLQKQHLSATEIAKLADIPRAKSYEVLDNLIKRNLCIEVLGNIKKFSAINPSEGISQIKIELKEKQIVAEQLSSSLENLFEARDDDKDPLDFVKVLRTRIAITNQVKQLAQSSNHKILSFCKRPHAMNINQPLDPIQVEFDVDSVEYYSIFEAEMDNLPDFMKRVQYHRSMGDKIRINYRLPLKLMIFDDKSVLFTLSNKIKTNKDFTAMSIEHEDLVQMHKETFELYWNNSMTIEEFAGNEKIEHLLNEERV